MKMFFITAMLVFSASPLHAKLKILTEDAPPLNYVKNGKPDGVAVAIVNELRKRTGETSEIEVVPWARGYDDVTKNPDVMLFSTTRTEARENLFKWVGPLAQKKWVFVKKKGSPITITSLDDAKKLKSVGAYKDDAKEQFLKEKGFTNVDSASEDKLNFKKLTMGRIEIWITGEDDLKDHAKALGEDLGQVEVAHVVDVKKLSIAFSKQTSDDVVKKWQAAYDTMVKDGTLKKIHEQYGSKID